MSRLTNNKLKPICDGYFVHFTTDEEARKYKMLIDDAPKYEDLYRKLAEYENLEEQGLLVKLPCKVGDTVYVIIGEMVEFEVYGFGYADGKWRMNIEDKKNPFSLSMDIARVGKQIFLTKEEAEKKLAELEEIRKQKNA